MTGECNSDSKETPQSENAGAFEKGQSTNERAPRDTPMALNPTHNTPPTAPAGGTETDGASQEEQPYSHEKHNVLLPSKTGASIHRGVLDGPPAATATNTATAGAKAASAESSATRNETNESAVVLTAIDNSGNNETSLTGNSAPTAAHAAAAGTPPSHAAAAGTPSSADAAAATAATQQMQAARVLQDAAQHIAAAISLLQNHFPYTCMLPPHAPHVRSGASNGSTYPVFPAPPHVSASGLNLPPATFPYSTSMAMPHATLDTTHPATVAGIPPNGYVFPSPATLHPPIPALSQFALRSGNGLPFMTTNGPTITTTTTTTTATNNDKNNSAATSAAVTQNARTASAVDDSSTSSRKRKRKEMYGGSSTRAPASAAARMHRHGQDDPAYEPSDDEYEDDDDDEDEEEGEGGEEVEEEQDDDAGTVDGEMPIGDSVYHPQLHPYHGQLYQQPQQERLQQQQYPMYSSMLMSGAGQGIMGYPLPASESHVDGGSHPPVPVKRGRGRPRRLNNGESPCTPASATRPPMSSAEEYGARNNGSASKKRKVITSTEEAAAAVAEAVAAQRMIIPEEGLLDVQQHEGHLHSQAEVNMELGPGWRSYCDASAGGTYWRIPGKNGQFACGECLKIFTRKHSVGVHRRTHRDQRPFVCKSGNCSKSFTTRSDLVRHSQVHSSAQARRKMTKRTQNKTQWTEQGMDSDDEEEEEAFETMNDDVEEYSEGVSDVDVDVESDAP